MPRWEWEWEWEGDVLQPCDKAALAGEGANLCPARSCREGVCPRKGCVQGSGVWYTVETRGACLMEHHYAKGVFSGADLGTKRLGCKWLKGAQCPNGCATPQVQSLSGPDTSEACSISINEVGEDLRVG